MAHYLLNICQPDGPPPDRVRLEAVMRTVSDLTARMTREGVLVYTAGLQPPSRAAVVVTDGDNATVVPGPRVQGDEHVGGFWIVAAPDEDSALEWARRASQAVGLPVEVRPTA